VRGLEREYPPVLCSSLLPGLWVFLALSVLVAYFLQAALAVFLLVSIRTAVLVCHFSVDIGVWLGVFHKHGQVGALLGRL